VSYYTCRGKFHKGSRLTHVSKGCADDLDAMFNGICDDCWVIADRAFTILQKDLKIPDEQMERFMRRHCGTV